MHHMEKKTSDTTPATHGLAEFLEDMGFVDTRIVARFPTREEALSKGFYNRYNLDKEGNPIW